MKQIYECNANCDTFGYTQSSPTTEAAQPSLRQLLESILADASAYQWHTAIRNTLALQPTTEAPPVKDLREAVAEYIAALGDEPIGSTARIRTLCGRIVTLACILVHQRPSATSEAPGTPDLPALRETLAEMLHQGALADSSRVKPKRILAATIERWVWEIEHATGLVFTPQKGERR